MIYLQRWNGDWREVNQVVYERWRKILDDHPSDWEGVAVAIVSAR